MAPRDRPAAARKRLRHANEIGDLDSPRVKEDVAIAYGNGKPIEEWDWEELSMGRARYNGQSIAPRTSSKAGILPKVINVEAQRRMRALTEHELMTLGGEAVKVLFELMTNNETNDWGQPVVSANVKLQASQYILNHIVGTPKQRHEISGDNHLAELMGGVLVNPDGAPSHHVEIIDGEIVEEDEDGE